MMFHRIGGSQLFMPACPSVCLSRSLYLSLCLSHFSFSLSLCLSLSARLSFAPPIFLSSPLSLSLISSFYLSIYLSLYLNSVNHRSYDYFGKKNKLKTIIFSLFSYIALSLSLSLSLTPSHTLSFSL